MLETYAFISDRSVASSAAVFALALVAYAGLWAIDRHHRVGSDDSSRPRQLAARLGASLTTLAWALLLVAVIGRALASQRVPWGNMYEFALVGTLGMVGLYLALLRPLSASWLGLPVTTVALASLMLASLLLYAPAGPLVPALQSYWLVVHVAAAILAISAFALGALTAGLYLVRERQERRGGDPERTALPTAAALDRLTYRIHAFAFPVWTFAALIAGPIWAKYAWGRYWGWDPKEVWAFITWVVYAAYLHSRATAGWSRRRSAVVALVGFATVLFDFIGINVFISGLHSYAGI